MAKRTPELMVAALFVAIHLAAPWVVGERYPITISPMFQDQPAEYCLYEVLDPDGHVLDPVPFGLHLVYDGNPPGLGMGIEPPPTLHAFGEVATAAELNQHVGQILADHPEWNLPAVTVRRIHVHPEGYQLTESVSEIKIWATPAPGRPGP